MILSNYSNIAFAMFDIVQEIKVILKFSPVQSSRNYFEPNFLSTSTLSNIPKDLKILNIKIGVEVISGRLYWRKFSNNFNLLDNINHYKSND